MGSTIEVQLLGGFSVRSDGGHRLDDGWPRRRATALIKLLALTPGQQLLRDEVIEALWPQLPPEAAASNLRKTAHHARRALGSDTSIVLAAGRVALCPEGSVVTDVERFEEAADEADRSRHVAAYRDAARLWHGELLPADRYEAWTEPTRERLRRRRLDVLRGAELWGLVLEADPVDEHAHRQIIRAHLAGGDRTGAIRQFDQLRTVLREQLGVSPDPETIALYEQVLAAEGGDAPTPAERARTLLAWGVVHWERADLDEAARAAAEVRALAIDAGLGRELVEASELLGLVAYAQGTWHEVFGREFLETVRRSPELAPFVLDANMCMSEFALNERGGVRTTARFAEQLLEVAATTGSTQAHALGRLLHGEAALLAATDIDRGEHELAEAARLHGEAGSVTGQALALSRLAQVAGARGDHDRARSAYLDAVALAAASPVRLHLLPFVHGSRLADAPVDEALTIVEEGERLADQEALCDPCSMPLHIGACHAGVAAGALERAAHHLAEAERIAVMWTGGPWHAAVDEARAHLQLARGAAGDEVAALLGRAAEAFAESDRTADAARCRAAVAALA